jgi:hypothetical protein
MSYCPKPAKTTKTNLGTPATKTVNPPGPRTEACAPASSTVITGGGTSTSNTVYVPGPAGPTGPQGPAGEMVPHNGIRWMGPWQAGAFYVKDDETIPQHADVVSNENALWVCIQDHLSDGTNVPTLDPEAMGWQPYWELMIGGGSVDIGFPGFSFGDVFTWFANASPLQLLGAVLGGIGVIWAGSKVIDAMSPSNTGTGDGDAASIYDGSDGLVLAGYTPPDIKTVLTELCEYAGISFNVSALPDAPCEFVLGNNTSVRTMIENLSLAYQFAMVDTNGTLKFIPRSAASVATITEDDLGFDTTGSANTRFVATRLQGITLPKTVTLRYYSPDIDYNVYTQTSQLFTYEDGQEVTLDVPVTMSHEDAKYVTEVSLVNAHLERQSYTFNLTYKFMLLEPGDVIETPMGLLRVTRISETSEGILQVVAVDAGGEISIAGSTLDVALPPASTNVPVDLGYSQAFYIDPTNLSSSDRLTRIYALVHGFGRPGWPGAQVYISENGGASYDLAATTYVEAKFGICNTVLAGADYHVWDNTSTVSVEIKAGKLSSVSELDVLNGKNKAMIGQEMIGFKNAVLTGPKTYTLSGLLRGRQGTEQFVSTHGPDELFALLDDGLVELPFEATDRGRTFKMKVVTIGSSVDKATAEDVQVVSSNLYPWQVYDATASKTAADYNLAWNGRNRYNNALQDFVVSPQDPDWGGYSVIVYDTDNTTIKKTYQVTGQTFVYTGAMQTTDFGTTRASCRFAICQYSTNVGAGFPVFVNA